MIRQILFNCKRLVKRLFFETFSEVNTEEDMREYLEKNFSLKKLTEELNNKDSEFYFAISDTHIVGYLKLNVGQAQTELNDNNGLEVERIYVLNEFHGKSVGQVLYDKAVETAKILKATYIWLGVWEENTKAIRFYKKNGFVPFDKHIFKLGNDEQTDIMMKLQLS